MVIQYIVEICVAIDIAILGIAYPIIVDKISLIGDKYSSNYLSELFHREYPQRKINIGFKKPLISFSLFKLILYTTILSFLFLIFPAKPLFGWDNIFINNSASLLVFGFTVLLAVSFFTWLDKVSLYSGKTTTLLNHIIGRHKNAVENGQETSYILKTINEFAFYAIAKQDEHIQKTLLEFYHREFYRIRKQHKKEEPLIYPVDLYFLVNKLIIESKNNEYQKLHALENRAVSGLWLLGEEYEEIIISDVTYSWLWHNINLICENHKYIKMYWSTAHQYFSTHMPPKHEDYDENGIVQNHKEIKRREIEREKFLEFHYALGGLLLYKSQYETIKYIFTYSQSIPPDYVLLPDTMHEIFLWFDRFTNDYSKPIDLTYYFPGLDNLGNSGQINAWICRYISLLFIRQFTLRRSYTFQDFIGQPHLPNKVNDLNAWLDNLTFFKRCLGFTISDEQLLKTLNYDQLTVDKKEDIDSFLTSLEDNIKEKIGYEKLNRELSEEKIAQYKNSSREVVKKAFNEFKTVFQPYQKELFNDLKVNVTGSEDLMSKSAFTDDDIPVIDFDTAFASFIVKDKIKRLIPEAFIQARTKRYLLNKHNLSKGIDIIINRNKEALIVGFNINYEIKEQLDTYKDRIYYLPYSDYSSQNLIFILSEEDLPSKQHEDLSEKVIAENKLELIDEDLKIYASVIDLTKQENQSFKEKWYGSQDIPVIKVQLAIEFITNIYWKKNRNIIQIEIASDLKEQGIENTLNEIEP